jgi:hypothetical protein
MIPTLIRRHAAIGTVTLSVALAAIVAGLAAPARTVQAQPNPSILTQQPPAACVCAAPVSVFGSGGPQIAHCQCGALQCAAATATGGVTLQCGVNSSLR